MGRGDEGRKEVTQVTPPTPLPPSKAAAKSHYWMLHFVLHFFAFGNESLENLIRAQGHYDKMKLIYCTLICPQCSDFGLTEFTRAQAHFSILRFIAANLIPETPDVTVTEDVPGVFNFGVDIMRAQEHFNKLKFIHFTMICSEEDFGIAQLFKAQNYLVNLINIVKFYFGYQGKIAHKTLVKAHSWLTRHLKRASSP